MNTNQSEQTGEGNAPRMWAWIKFSSARKAIDCMNTIESYARVRGISISGLRRDGYGMKQVHFECDSTQDATTLARLYRHRDSHGWETTKQEREAVEAIEGNAPRATGICGPINEIPTYAQVTAQRDELLAALKTADADMVAIMEDCDAGEFEIDPQFAIARIRTAIAKAEQH